MAGRRVLSVIGVQKVQKSNENESLKEPKPHF